MTAETREYQLSQYADGSLPEGDRAAVEAWLAGDPAARAAVAGYRRLDAALAALPSVAGVDWDALGGRISVALGNSRPAVAGRIGVAVRRAAWWGGMAVAATVGLAVGARMMQPTVPAPVPIAAKPVLMAPPAVAVVSGPAAEGGSGPASVQVSIGPSPVVSAGASADGYAYGLARHPARVTFNGRVRSSASDFAPTR